MKTIAPEVDLRLALAPTLSHRIEDCLAPLLVRLDKLLDRGWDEPRDFQDERHGIGDDRADRSRSDSARPPPESGEGALRRLL